MTRGAAGEPAVSVLVPVLNEARHLEATLARMREQDFPNGYEILVIDGGSTDGSREILEEIAAVDARVRVLDNPARRTPHALNIGLRAARGEYVARMDAHAFYRPDYLALGVARLAGDVEWVSGPAIAQGTGTWSRRVALALATPMGVGGARFRRHSGEEEVDTTFAGVWRRETLLAYGGWDEGWPINQDAELAARVRANGGKILCRSEMAAGYIPRDDLAALARQYARYGWYRAKTARRHPHSMRRSHVLAPSLVLTVFAAALPGRQRPVARIGLAAWWSASLATAVGAARRGARPADAATVPLVLGVMHLAWGSGFLVGAVRFGPPLRALAHIAGFAR
jgi:succinoglycan biosynthesis protein ExoA